MSSCRCGEISNYRNRISNLDSAIWRLEHCAGKISGISNNLFSLSMYSRQAYSSDSMETLSTRIRGLDDDMISVKTDFQQAVVKKREQLSIRLSEMQTEDNNYHEEQRRKAQEEAEKAAAEAARLAAKAGKVIY